MFKFITTTALVSVSSAAMAEDAFPYTGPLMTGEIAVDVAENAAGDWGATTSLDLGIVAGDVAFGSVDFVATPGGNLSLDEYTIGASISGASLSFGDQGNVWIDAENGSTLEDPAMDESFQVSAVGATMAFGWTDIGSDVTDIENVQGKYETTVGMAHVAAAGDYNFNSKEWVMGGRADAYLRDNIAVGAAVTYGSASEVFGFEADASVMGVTAYLNGDQNDMAQNVGGSYDYDFNGLKLGAGLNYDLNAEVATPTFSAAFAF